MENQGSKLVFSVFLSFKITKVSLGRCNGLIEVGTRVFPVTSDHALPMSDMEA